MASPKPHRSAGGHRQYSLQEIEALALTPAVDLTRLGRALRAVEPAAVILTGRRVSLDVPARDALLAHLTGPPRAAREPVAAPVAVEPSWPA